MRPLEMKAPAAGASTRRAFLSAPAAFAAAGAGQRRPNVVVLLSDQHRPDLMTCAGSSMVPTPSLDRLAARGVRFEHAYCPYPVCAPSRMSFLTGLYPHSHGVLDNTMRLGWRQRTVAHHFREHGYNTGLIGKMHFLDGQNHGFEYRLGFNDWLMYLGPKVQHFANEIASYPGYEKTVYDTGSGLPDVADVWDGPSPWVGKVTPPAGLASELAAGDHFDAFVAREAVRFIRRYKDEPFFLVAGFLKPHAPFHPPKGYAEELYPPERIELPPPGDVTQYPKHVQAAVARYQAMGERRLRMICAGYLGNLRYLDVCIGDVLKALEEAGLVENTIVVYTSDHGEMRGEHGLFQKFVFFEPSVGVPLIVSYPRAVPAGKVSRALVEYQALYPTLSDLAGLPSPGQLDRASFGSLVHNPDAPGPPAVFAEYALSWAPRYMIRTDRYKYIYNEGDIAELYDLEPDPGERINRAASMEGVRARLHEQLLSWYDPARNPFRKSKEPQR